MSEGCNVWAQKVARGLVPAGALLRIEAALVVCACPCLGGQGEQRGRVNGVRDGRDGVEGQQRMQLFARRMLLARIDPEYFASTKIQMYLVHM